jgi:hypothetical protein
MQADDVAAPCVPHMSRSRSGELVNVAVAVIVLLVVNWVQRVFQFSNTWNINGGSSSVKRIGRDLVKILYWLLMERGCQMYIEMLWLLQYIQ